LNFCEVMYVCLVDCGFVVSMCSNWCLVCERLLLILGNFLRKCLSVGVRNGIFLVVDVVCVMSVCGLVV